LKDYIEERVLDVAKYIIDSKSTIRKAAKVFGVSKSTIHKDMTERLLKINPEIAEETHLVLELNKSQRHIRGGIATQMKYKIIESQ
jgi:putative DeoR family transcriptional regulator (stage III sporulation protein D)